MKMKKTSKVKLPFNIRNELRMLCAMKGYSSMKGGKGKTLMQQYDTLYAYYHGKEPSRPSQIKILCSGGYGYGDLYDSIQKVATSKSASTETTEELVLKKDLHRDPTRVFRAKKEINYLDLEKKSTSSPLLVTGRTLLALAKTGHKNYKRALSFAEQKWDFVKGVEKDSGTTIDDVLLLVRQGMYDYMNKNKDSSSDIEDIGDAKVDKLIILPLSQIQLLRKKQLKIVLIHAMIVLLRFPITSFSQDIWLFIYGAHLLHQKIDLLFLKVKMHLKIKVH